MDPFDWTLFGNAGTDPNTNFLGTTDGQPLVIQLTGNVGIGTTAPTQQLQITGNELLPTADANFTGNLFFGGDTSAGTNGLRLFSLDSAGGGFIDVKTSSIGNGIIFRVNISDGGTEQMRITAGGNVGIGTTTPGSKLEVAGGDGNIGIRATGAGGTIPSIPPPGGIGVGAVVAYGSPGILVQNNVVNPDGTPNVFPAMHVVGGGTEATFVPSFPLPSGGSVPPPALFVENDGNVGVGATTISGIGVFAHTIVGHGVLAMTPPLDEGTGTAIEGFSQRGIAIRGESPQGTAGHFGGNVEIFGTLEGISSR